MSRLAREVKGMGDGFPRVSGDEPWAGALTPGGETFSPRERGCARPPNRLTSALQVFPA